MSVASPRLVYPMTQLSAWQESPASTPVVVSKLGQKEFQQLSVVTQPRRGKLEVEKAHEGLPAGRQTPVRA